MNKFASPSKLRPWNSLANAVLKLSVLIPVLVLLTGSSETDDEDLESTEEPAEKVELQITIADVREEVGTIYIGVYTNEETWKDLDPTHKLTAKPASPKTTVTIELEPGEYAVSTYHDVNDDEEFNRKGVFRLPGEPFAFSNDPKIRMRIPSWKRVKFKVDVEEKEHTLTLKHP